MIKTIKALINYFLIELDEFVIYDNSDPDYKFLKNNQIVLCGDDDTEVFMIEITKL